MEMEEIQAHKFPRISNGGNNGHRGDDEEVQRGGGSGGGGGRSSRSLSLGGWPSSRIVRVSRASGGKDRHSKVLTSKGLRDRRVRLSVHTAIQFYDLQDRLGYDQPSKAVEWLLKAAAPSIAELPSLNPPFSTSNNEDESRDENQSQEQVLMDSAEMEAGEQNLLHQKSCSSTSETSKGSGLSLSRSDSRSESRIRARERARERTAEKEKENESSNQFHQQQHNLSPISSSFTELLTGNNNNNSPNSSSVHQTRGDSTSQWSSSTPIQYFTTANGMFCPQLSSSRGMDSSLLTNSPLNSVSFAELQQLSYSSQHDHLAPVVTAGSNGNGNDNGNNNLNFSILPSSSSCIVGFNNNRGTLQSNSSPPSLLPHFRRFHQPPQPPLPSFFTVAAAAPNTAAATVDNHHHPQQQHYLQPGFDGSLHLFYGDAARLSDHKGKGKS